MSKPLDENVLQECINNSRKAQEVFYNHFCRTMYAVCLRYSSSAEDANDILQEGFIKAFTKLKQYTGKGSLEGWLKRIFINTALEHYRVNKVYFNQTDIENAHHTETNSYVLETLSVKEILVVLNNMAPGYRTVINMYAVEGYTHAEIADILGITEGTSKSQLARARQVFAAELRKIKLIDKSN